MTEEPLRTRLSTKPATNSRGQFVTETSNKPPALNLLNLSLVESHLKSQLPILRLAQTWQIDASTLLSNSYRLMYGHQCERQERVMDDFASTSCNQIYLYGLRLEKWRRADSSRPPTCSGAIKDALNALSLRHDFEHAVELLVPFAAGSYDNALEATLFGDSRNLDKATSRWHRQAAGLRKWIFRNIERGQPAWPLPYDARNPNGATPPIDCDINSHRPRCGRLFRA